MGYRIAADSVLLAHFLFAAFAVFGGILVAFDFTWAWIHIPVVIWSSLVNLMSSLVRYATRELRSAFGLFLAQLATAAVLSSITSDAPSIHAGNAPGKWNWWPATPSWPEMSWCTLRYY